jgi:hypothetical protein
VRLTDLRIFKEHTANGSGKRWKTVALRATIAGLKRLPLAGCLLLRRSKTILASKAMHREVVETDGTYALTSRLKPMRVIFPAKMRL